MTIRNFSKSLGSLGAAALLCATPVLAHDDPHVPPKEFGVSSQITGVSFLTSDAERSAAFYVDYLGFKVLRDSISDSEATRGVYGLLRQESVRIILVVPGRWTEEDPFHLGIAFAQVEGDIDNPYPRQGDRYPRSGEPTMGFEVNDLDTIMARMAEADVPIVVPVALSATGRSRAITVLDPNGLRIQLYEYVEETS